MGYQQAFEYHQLKVIGGETRTAAQQARRLHRNSSDEVLEELEAHVESKQNEVEENCKEDPSMEGVCSSLTKELLAEGKQGLMVHLVKQELPEVLIRSNGGLDPGEVVDFKDMVEVVAILGTEEEKQRMLMEVRDCGGLDPGEAVNKVVMEECGFKAKVKKCGFKDKMDEYGFKEKVGKFVIKDRVEVKPDMRMEEKYVTKDRMEVKHRPQEVRHRPQEVRPENLVQKGEAKFGDPKVRALVCNIFLNLEFELLLAWMMMMLHKTLRVRLVKFCTPDFCDKSRLRLSDYG